MPKYGSKYMSVYDGSEYALVALTLSASTMPANSAENTVVGAFVGKADATDSVLTLVDNDGGRFKITGNNLVAGAVASAAGTRNVTVRETNIYGSNNPRDTVLAITVTE